MRHQSKKHHLGKAQDQRKALLRSFSRCLAHRLSVLPPSGIQKGILSARLLRSMKIFLPTKYISRVIASVMALTTHSLTILAPKLLLTISLSHGSTFILPAMLYAMGLLENDAIVLIINEMIAIQRNIEKP